MKETAASLPTYEYTACGGVLFDGDFVLVLRRPGLDQIRLPKGHLEPGESIEEAALRELFEEAGFANVEIVADLGNQFVEFDYRGRRWNRTERYFAMRLSGSIRQPTGPGEAQFEPVWISWEEAIVMLTFEAEKEWVRRARALHE